jgi:hypothetical protein
MLVLLNQLPVLDKGYIALVSSMNDSKRLKEIGLEFFGVETVNQKTIVLGQATMVLKCPIFVHLFLSKFNFTIVVTKNPEELEAYCPSPGEIGCKDHATNKLISDDIERTTAALLINPKAYQADGCDRFTSQLIMPVSTYTTILVSGSHEQWSRFCKQSQLPAPIESYRLATVQIMNAEWR